MSEPEIERIRALLNLATGANDNGRALQDQQRHRLIGRIEGVLAAQEPSVSRLVLDAIEQRFVVAGLDALDNQAILMVARSMARLLTQARLAAMPSYPRDLPIMSLKWGDSEGV